MFYKGYIVHSWVCVNLRYSLLLKKFCVCCFILKQSKHVSHFTNSTREIYYARQLETVRNSVWFLVPLMTLLLKFESKATLFPIFMIINSDCFKRRLPFTFCPKRRCLCKIVSITNMEILTVDVWNFFSGYVCCCCW